MYVLVKIHANILISLIDTVNKMRICDYEYETTDITHSCFFYLECKNDNKKSSFT